MSKLCVIHYTSNEDLPESVRLTVPDDIGLTILRTALNSNLVDGKSETHAYVRAYRTLEDAGYTWGETVKKWLAPVTKAQPGLNAVHVDRPLGDDEDEEELDKTDKITVDVPLFIRLLELAREEIKTDVPLHEITERITELLEGKSELTMADYDGIVGKIKKADSDEDETSLLITFAKYDPEQPRDESGKWTDGGGGIATESKYASEPRVFNTRDEIVERSSWGEKYWGWKDQPGLKLTGNPLDKASLPETLYHVTTAADAVAGSGVLLGQNKDAGLGGGQADGVSFTSDPTDAEVIQRELTRAAHIAREEDGLDAFDRYAREDERAAGLPLGTLNKAVDSAKYTYSVNAENQYYKDHPEKLKGLVHDAFNQYLNSRDWNFAKNAPILKNPILFSDRDTLARMDPMQIRILTVPSRNIPERALITTGSDSFLHEVRAYSDVPVKGMKITKSLKGVSSGQSHIELNEKGQELARELGERIAAKGGLDVLHTSPLPRATQTADALAARNLDAKREEPAEALRPWRMGELEGTAPDPKRVHHFIVFEEDAPPGKGADGQPGESFKDAKIRQLDYLLDCNTESEISPKLKIGVVTHSRVMELLRAWVENGMPEDYKLTPEQVFQPEESKHADALLWTDGKIEEVDLGTDEPLKPGVYLIRHSLTDDDEQDRGNDELEKFDEDQPRDGGGRWTSTGGAAGKDAKQILSAVNVQPKLRAWLKESKAVRKVNFSKKDPVINTMYGQITISAGYDYDKREIIISNAPPSKSDYGKTFKAGIQSVVHAAKDPTEYKQRLLIHEIGHAIRERGNLFHDTLRHFTGVGAATKYGQVDGDEHFAETFSAYVYHRDELAKADPDGFKYMRSALRKVGIL